LSNNHKKYYIQSLWWF